MSEIGGRRIYYLATVAIVAIVLISAIAVTRPLTTQITPPTTSTTKTLQITGTGTVTSDPDEAILLLAVQTQAASATQATADNAAITSRAIDALVSVGVGKDRIETVSYTLSPIYESKSDQTTAPKVLGYIVRNAIQARLSDFNLVGKALDTAISAGVNEVQGIMFTLSRTKFAALQKQALQMAIQDADGQAKAMASTLGISLVGPISVTPGYAFQPVFEKISVSAAQTPIQPGTLQVTAMVQVTYEFA